MKQSQCPMCGRDVLADFPGLRSVCPECEKFLKENNPERIKMLTTILSITGQTEISSHWCRDSKENYLAIRLDEVSMYINEKELSRFKKALEVKQNG